MRVDNRTSYSNILFRIHANIKFFFFEERKSYVVQILRLCHFKNNNIVIQINIYFEMYLLLTLLGQSVFLNAAVWVRQIVYPPKLQSFYYQITSFCFPGHCFCAKMWRDSTTPREICNKKAVTLEDIHLI